MLNDVIRFLKFFLNSEGYSRQPELYHTLHKIILIMKTLDAITDSVFKKRKAQINTHTLRDFSKMTSRI